MKNLAPNGKVSNLTAEQYELVRTPAFKKWFGDWENDSENSSKVIDENGEPMVVYHGSKYDFNVFNPDLAGKSSRLKRTRRGVYFSSKINVAESFIHNYKMDEYGLKVNDGSVYKVFLNLKTPNIINAQGKDITWWDSEIRDIEWSEVRFKDNNEKGFIILNTIDTMGDLIEYSDIYIAYNSNQIKLADGTNTEFDEDNDDIRFAKGGEALKKMLAPNGKVSNLTAEQYELVRTPAFKKWFGDWENDSENSSKVVDENGEPLVVYHGTNKKFDSFKTGEKQYVYFTSDINLADKYATHRYNKKNIEKNIYSVYLKIVNPLIVDANFESWDYISTKSIENSKDAIKDLLKRGVDRITTNKTPEIAIKYGLDGVIIKNVHDGVGYGKDADVSNVYVVLNSNQIKLADGTNTKFDIDNEDIRFEKGGEALKKMLAPNGKVSNLNPKQYELVRTPAFKKWFGDWEKLEKMKLHDSIIDEIALWRFGQGVSQIVDENGEPLVVYHFTDKEFNIFELKGLSKGFFFTEYRQDDEFSTDGAVLSMGLTKQEIKEKGLESKYDETKSYFLDIKKMREGNLVRKDLWSTPAYENAVIEFDKKQNTGVEFIRATDKKRIIVAFNPNQIKLADGTNTEFNGSNPDIRFDGGGLIKSNHNILGSAIKLEIIPKIKGHDMIAECADCNDKFSYQKVKSNILWECPNCLSKKHIS